MNERIKLFLVVMCMPICACDMYKQQDCIGFVCFSTVTPRFLPLHTPLPTRHTLPPYTLHKPHISDSKTL